MEKKENNKIRLLILTQKLDKNDDILGFMHGWVAEFAKHWEKITVIVLSAGQYDLPSNVEVLSLGKETSGSKLKYLVRFYTYIWRERKNYNSVFVHMNQEYAILGGLFWQLAGKKVMLWRNHQHGGFWARIAVFFSDIVFCTSKFAFVARYKKTKIMPVGINTDFFKPDMAIKKTDKSILFFSRISPIKKPDIFIEALDILRKENIDFAARIIGDAPARDKNYLKRIKQSVEKCGLSDRVEFKKGAPNWRAPEIFNQHEIFVNLTFSGSLDKTIFEAMACGSLVLISNRSLLGQIDQRLFFAENNPQDLSIKLKEILSLSASEKEGIIKESRDFVIQKHSLDFLVKKILENL